MTSQITQFILDKLQKRPALFLGKPELSRLAVFITGYQIALPELERKRDCYFGENGFVKWLTIDKNLNIVSDWMSPFLEMTNNNEEKALQEYFKMLQLYRTENKINE